MKKVFKDVNGYPTKIIDKCHNKVRMKMMTPENNQEETRTEDEEDRKRPYVILPYMGEKGEKILKAMKRRIPEKIRPRTVYQGTKLSAFFSTKCTAVISYITTKEAVPGRKMTTQEKQNVG